MNQASPSTDTASTYIPDQPVPTLVWSVFRLHNVPMPVRIAASAGAIAISIMWGILMLHLHTVWSRDAASGQSLNFMAALLAKGSTWVTVWPGWVAAAAFSLATVQLLRGPAEPPLGAPPDRTTSVGATRAGLRREYHIVQGALWLVSAGYVLDLGRAVVYGISAATGDPLARSDIFLVFAEVVGLSAATVALLSWTVAFRRQLIRWGVSE